VQEGVGWTEPFWRECYVLGCACAAVVLVAAGGDTCAPDAAAALRSLDMAFIMGAPPEVVQPFVDVVEPHVTRAARPRGDGPDTLLPRTLPSAAAPALCEGHELRRLDAAGWGAFRKEYYNVDKPVVLAGVAGACACAPVLCSVAARGGGLH
jgi:hypothetical protein